MRFRPLASHVSRLAPPLPLLIHLSGLVGQGGQGEDDYDSLGLVFISRHLVSPALCNSAENMADLDENGTTGATGQLTLMLNERQRCGDMSERTNEAVEVRAPELARFTSAHLQQAVGLSSELGWPYRLEDWAFAQGLGEGFVLERAGRLIGTAMRWQYGHAFATLGMIIVANAAQGRGYGARLFDALLDDAGSQTRQACPHPRVARRPSGSRDAHGVSSGPVG